MEASYRTTKAERQLLNQMEIDWQLARNQRTRANRNLGNISIEEFWKASRDAYNGYDAEVGNFKAWRSKVFRRVTRNKVVATVAQFVASGIGLDFAAVDQSERIDRGMSKMAEDVYEWSLDREEFDYNIGRAILEMVVSGTVHLMETLTWQTRTVKDILDIDFETMEVETETRERVDFKGTKFEIVPNEEIYPGDVYIPEVQDQPFYFRRKVTNYASAKATFGKFKRFKHVEKGTRSFFGTEDDGKEQEQDSDDKVEILWYINRPKDQMAMVINGILMTPAGYPMPYPHKKYPFAKSVYEMFADTRYYYGDSLPHKIGDEQEVENHLWRHFMDSEDLKLRPPLFSTTRELSGQDTIVPGAFATIEPNDEVQTIPELTRGVSGDDMALLEANRRQADESSVDPLLSGQQAGGDTTATEVRTIVGSAERIRGYNEQFIGHLLVQFAKLRLANMFWFIAHDEDFRTIVRNNVRIKGGSQTGRREIVFVHAFEMPKDPLEASKMIKSKEKKAGDDVQFIYTPMELMDKFDYHVTISAVPKPRQTSASRLARAIAKYQLYAQNQMVDQAVNTRKLVEAMGDDPDELVGDPQQMDAAGATPATIGLPPQNENLAKALTQEGTTLDV